MHASAADARALELREVPPGAPSPAPRASVERVTSIRRWTPSLWSLRTTRPPGFRFTPGHYARLGLPGDDGALVWRPYSIVSAREAPFLEFLLVLVPGGAFSRAVGELHAGDSIRIALASFGFMTMDQLAPGDSLWLLASGTGVGPFVSILQDTSTWRSFARVIVVHSVRRAADLAYADEIERLGEGAAADGARARLCRLPIVTRQPGASALAGRLPALVDDGRLEQAAGAALSADTARVMACGNPEMTAALRSQLRARGFATSRRGVAGQMAFENYW